MPLEEVVFISLRLSYFPALDASWIGCKLWFELQGEYRSGTLKAVDVAAKRIIVTEDATKQGHKLPYPLDQLIPFPDHRIPHDLVFPMNPPMLEGTEDLTALSYLVRLFFQISR